MADTTETASFDALTPADLDGAVRLSRAERWPHAGGERARRLARRPGASPRLGTASP
jgi:hypothetical protein